MEGTAIFHAENDSLHSLYISKSQTKSWRISWRALTKIQGLDEKFLREGRIGFCPNPTNIPKTICFCGLVGGEVHVEYLCWCLEVGFSWIKSGSQDFRRNVGLSRWIHLKNGPTLPNIQKKHGPKSSDSLRWPTLKLTQHLPWIYLKRKLVFQPFIFRRCVSFSEGSSFRLTPKLLTKNGYFSLWLAEELWQTPEPKDGPFANERKS